MRNRITRSNRRSVRRSNRRSVRRSNRRSVRRSNRRSVRRSNRRTNRKRNNRRIKKQLYGGAYERTPYQDRYALSSEDESSSFFGMSTTSSDAKDYITRNPHIFYVSSTDNRYEELWDYPIIKFYKSEFNRLSLAFKPYDKIHTIDGKEVTISKDIHLTKWEKILGDQRHRPGGFQTLISFEDVWIGKYKVQYGEFLEELKNNIGWPPSERPKDVENNGKIPKSILEKYKKMFEEINKLAYRILSREKLESKKRKELGITFYNDISEDKLIRELEASHKPIPIPNTRNFKIEFQNFMGRGERHAINEGNVDNLEPIEGLLDELIKPPEEPKQNESASPNAEAKAAVVKEGKQAWVSPKSYETNSDVTDSDNIDRDDNEWDVVYKNIIENEEIIKNYINRETYPRRTLNNAKEILSFYKNGTPENAMKHIEMVLKIEGKNRPIESILLEKWGNEKLEEIKGIIYMNEDIIKSHLKSKWEDENVENVNDILRFLETWDAEKAISLLNTIIKTENISSPKEMATLNKDRFSLDDKLDDQKIAKLAQTFAIQREKDKEEERNRLLTIAKSAADAVSLDTAKATAAAEAAAKKASAAAEIVTKQAEEIKRLQEEMDTMREVLGKRTMATIPEIEPSASDIVGEFEQEMTGLSKRLETDRDAARTRLMKRKPNAIMPTKTVESRTSASEFSKGLTGLGSMESPAKLGELNTRGFRGR
jgi:hypothetical protein